MIGKGDTKRRWIATRDHAALVPAVAVEPDPPRVISVGGPEAISKNDAAAIVQTATGRSMKVRHMPRPVARLAIRVLDKPNAALASALGAGLLQDTEEANWNNAALQERGIKARPVRDFLRDQARALT